MDTSGQSNSTTGRIATAHEWFNSIHKLRQCATHLIHASLVVGPTRVQSGILIGSAVFAQLTAESHYTLQRAAGRFSP